MAVLTLAAALELIYSTVWSKALAVILHRNGGSTSTDSVLTSEFVTAWNLDPTSQIVQQQRHRRHQQRHQRVGHYWLHRPHRWCCRRQPHRWRLVRRQSNCDRRSSSKSRNSRSRLRMGTVHFLAWTFSNFDSWKATARTQLRR